MAMVKRVRIFTCLICDWTGESDWTDAEARAERVTLFPGASDDECETVCDDCHKQLMDGRDEVSPEFVNAVRRAVAKLDRKNGGGHA